MMGYCATTINYGFPANNSTMRGEESWIESQGKISLTCLRHSRQTANGVICSLLIETIAFKSDLSFHSKTDIFVRSHGSLCIKQVRGPHSPLLFSSKAIQTISLSVFSKV